MDTQSFGIRSPKQEPFSIECIIFSAWIHDLCPQMSTTAWRWSCAKGEDRFVLSHDSTSTFAITLKLRALQRMFWTPVRQKIDIYEKFRVHVQYTTDVFELPCDRKLTSTKSSVFACSTTDVFAPCDRKLTSPKDPCADENSGSAAGELPTKLHAVLGTFFTGTPANIGY